jgi:gamma-glutamylcyclotransferase (GGCT)/AIG2-like uncharacterized protein YtfP
VEFRLFVYGTLKHGCPAHARYCSAALRWTRSAARGRLFEHDEGYPVLVVPASSVYAIGTRDAFADARTLSSPAFVTRQTSAASRPLRLNREASFILGEILEFDPRRLPLAELDEYEGFRPGQPSSFLRALIDVSVPRHRCVVKAWSYVAGPTMSRAALAPLPGGVWRA